MKQTRFDLFLLLILLLVSLPIGSRQILAAEGGETPAGIGFSGTTTSSSTTPSDSGGTEPSVPKNPVIKPGGKLPITGELATPILFILLGIVLLTLVMVFFLSQQKKKEEDDE